MSATNCSRCKGRGFGDWVVQNGICFGCQGRGTRAAQLALRDAARALERRIREVEEVSILVHVAEELDTRPRRQAASIAYFEGFVGADRDGWGMSPVWTELAPGWYATTVRMHPDDLA